MNYRVRTLTSIAAKIYNARLRNRIEPKIEKIFRKNQNFDYRSNFIRYSCKNLEATILFVDFSKAFDSIHRGKMEQILLGYGLPKETVAAIKMRYKSMKVKVHPADGDKDYFDVIAGLLHGDTLVPY